MQPFSDDSDLRLCSLSLHTDVEQYDASMASLADTRTSDSVTRELRTRRNATIPAIVLLPDDILADLFALVAHDCREKRVKGWGPFAWIRISHVSRHWRTVALDHSILWASQVQILGNQDRVQAFLHRAKDALLTVSAPAFDLHVYNMNLTTEENNANKEPDPAVFEAVQPLASRFRNLSMDVTNRLCSALVHSPSLDASRLASLDLQFHYAFNASNTHLWFLSDAPLGSLTELKLNHAPFSLTRTLVRTTLTRLIFQGSMVSVANWLDLLTLTPCLEYLRLTQTIARGPEPLPRPGTTVTLPRLHKLVLEAQHDDNDTELVFASLLMCLVIPAGCSFAMTHVEPWCDLHHAKLLSALAAKVHATGHGTPPTLPLRACTLHLENGYFDLELWEHPEDVVRYRRESMSPWGWPQREDDAPGVFPVLHLSVLCRGQVNLPDALQACLRSMPLSAVTSLSVFLHTQIWTSDESRLHPIFPAFPHITDLFYVQPVPQILWHLAEPCDPDLAPSLPWTYPLFPRLRTLTLRSVFWNAHSLWGRRVVQSATPQAAEIEAMLDARREMGVPLAMLRLESLHKVRDVDLLALEAMAEAREEEITWTVGSTL